MRPSESKSVLNRPASVRPALRLAMLAAAAAASSAAFAEGRIVITEVMYNPASDERRGEPEWVEIANVGDAPVVMADWKLDDEDTRQLDDWGTFTLTLAPGAVAVLVNGDAVDEAQFRAAWDDPAPNGGQTAYVVVPVSWGGISNNPSETNEQLRLVDSGGTVVCTVNLQNGGTWPRLSPAGGPSLYMVAPHSGDPNDGASWKASEAGVEGARVCRATAVFNGRDIGSPGRIPATVTAAAPAASAAPPASTVDS